MKKLILTVCATVFLSSFLIQAQENKVDRTNNQKQSTLHIKVKDGAKPDIYVDGKKFDFSLEIIDKNMIKSVSVIKGEKAINEYKAPQGVILVTTKKKKDLKKDKVRLKGKIDNEPLVIIDGKKLSKRELNKIKPKDFENMTILKDEVAMKMYNSPGGVIIIKTKKKK